MSRTPLHPAVRITARPLWRIRLTRELPRYLLGAVSVAGVAASLRFAIAPPHAPAPAAHALLYARPDLAAEGYAVLFARRYLTWDASDPQASERALAPLIGPGMEPAAGLRPAPAGEQHVEWAQPVQERELRPGERVYTVAAQTDTAGLLYLTVSVARGADGTLALAGYPAFVGAPASGSAQAAGRLREVTDPALTIVVERGLRNYLAASAGELAADLTSAARVSLPPMALSMTAVQRLDWSPAGSSVLALVQAQDARGAAYTLAYELDVSRLAGRWEISAVQMNPYA